jgi:hypothetical protein
MSVALFNSATLMAAQQRADLSMTNQSFAGVTMLANLCCGDSPANFCNDSMIYTDYV